MTVSVSLSSVLVRLYWRFEILSESKGGHPWDRQIELGVICIEVL